MCMTLTLRRLSTAVRAFVGSRRTTVLFTVLPTARSVTVSLDKTDMYIENATADDFKNIWYSYFDFSLDYGKIREEISTIHPVLNEAAKYARA